MAWQLPPEGEQPPSPQQQTTSQQHNAAGTPPPEMEGGTGAAALPVSKPELQHKESFKADGTPSAPRKETYKRQKREYRDEKKRVAKELVSALRDPTVVVMADWLKVRGTLRKWNRYFCVLKPGLMLIYKNNKTHKHGYWVGTILLNTCELIERPSKKDGFCFKLFHPLDQNIWATRGPLGESHGAVTLQPLPSTHLICRAPSDQAGRCWMDALELALRCSGLLMRTMHNLEAPEKKEELKEDNAQRDLDSVEGLATGNDEKELSETEAERHFVGLDDHDEAIVSDGSENGDTHQESNWVASDLEQFGQLGEGAQTEEVAEENKSLVWTLLKQVRPGMDLSKVVLPTFILEPRSFLEKLADYYYHSDLLASAALEDDPYQRMITVVKFYISGFYKKPKGLKKPYNPILGETFRCCWQHPDGSVTYYIAEQVSHHPPISSIFITNRKAGYNICGTILAKSKYYGNSLSAMMLGHIRVTLLNRGETYSVTLPYANCKGLMIGTLTMELGGQVTIECDRTAYSSTLDFQLKPFLGGSMNKVSGQIKYGKQVLAEIDGHWDDLIRIKSLDQGTKEVLWQPTAEVIKQRLPRMEIPIEQQDQWESKRLWSKVTAAIEKEDQYEATAEKTVLEEEQRARARSGVPHKPKFFKKNTMTDTYEYAYADYRPWDPHNDIKQIECNYRIETLSKVKPVQRPKLPADTPDVGNAHDLVMPSDDSSDSMDGGSRQRKQKEKLTYELAESIKESLEKTEISLQRINEKLEALSSTTSSPISTQQVIVAIILFSIFHAILARFLTK